MATILLLVIYVAFISLGLPDSLLGAAWPVMRTSLSAELDAAGLVSMVITVGTILSSLLSERTTRRFGAGRVTTVSVAATAGALLGFSWAPSLWWLVLFAVPLGLGAGAVDAALNNYVALHYAARHMSWLHCFWGIGAFGGPLILSLFIRQNGNWRGGYFAVAMIQFAVVLLLFFTLPLWQRQGGRQELGGEAKHAPATGDALGNRAAFRLPGVRAALLTFLLYCAAENAVGLWSSSFLAEVRGFSEAAAASNTSLYYLGITLGRFVTGLLTVRFASRTLIRSGVLLFLAGSAVFLLPVPAFAGAGLLMMGLGSAPVYPCMIHETPARFGPANSQKIIGWQMASAYIGMALIPPLLGLLAAQAGMWVMPLCYAGVGLGLLVCSERVARVSGKAGK